MNAPHHTMYGPARQTSTKASLDQHRMAKDHGGTWCLVYNTRHGTWYTQLREITLESYERGCGCLYMRPREEAHPELFGARGFLSRLLNWIGL